MKITVYNCREDETDYFAQFGKKYNTELSLHTESPTMETAGLAAGSPCISVITTPMTEPLLQTFKSLGVGFVSTRSIGYDHIDLAAAKKLGVRIGNVSYSPDSVADYTVMLILMATRKMKTILGRSAVQDYSLKGVQGSELHNLTVGVAGTGRIGRTVIRRLSGFGCRLLAYDLYKNEEAKRYAEYVPLERFLAESDLITLHMPATRENHHFLNRDAFARMKDGVFLVNTARGALVDTGDLIDAVESGKVGGAALDVVEHETGLYYNDLKCQVIGNRELAVLRSFPNVLVTPHTAFYTDQAVSDMVENSIRSCVLFARGEENPWEVK